MHKNSYLRMKWFYDNYVKSYHKVLDIGSANINGSYRDIFKKNEYHGADMNEGDNVDIILKNPYNWDIDTDFYDVVISGQTFEHVEFFWLTMQEIVRVTKKGGIICIIAPNGFGEHRYPVDCYRFFTDGMIALAKYTNLYIAHADTNLAPNGYNWYSDKKADSMLIAYKLYSGEPVLIDRKNYVFKQINDTSVRWKKRKHSLYKRFLHKLIRLMNIYD